MGYLENQAMQRAAIRRRMLNGVAGDATPPPMGQLPGLGADTLAAMQALGINIGPVQNPSAVSRWDQQLKELSLAPKGVAITPAQELKVSPHAEARRSSGGEGAQGGGGVDLGSSLGAIFKNAKDSAIQDAIRKRQGQGSDTGHGASVRDRARHGRPGGPSEPGQVYGQPHELIPGLQPAIDTDNAPPGAPAAKAWLDQNRGGPAVTGVERGAAFQGGKGGNNVASWMEFAQRDVDKGGLGFSRQQASGFVGAMQAESGKGLDPGILNKEGSGAFGTAQWLGVRKTGPDGIDAFANKHFKGDNASVAAQQAFVRREFLGLLPDGTKVAPTEGRAYSMIKQTNTPEQAAVATERGYERSGGELMKDRMANARRLHDNTAIGGAQPIQQASQKPWTPSAELVQTPATAPQGSPFPKTAEAPATVTTDVPATEPTPFPAGNTVDQAAVSPKPIGPPQTFQPSEASAQAAAAVEPPAATPTDVPLLPAPQPAAPPAPAWPQAAAPVAPVQPPQAAAPAAKPALVGTPPAAFQKPTGADAVARFRQMTGGEAARLFGAEGKLPAQFKDMTIDQIRQLPFATGQLESNIKDIGAKLGFTEKDWHQHKNNELKPGKRSEAAPGTSEALLQQAEAVGQPTAAQPQGPQYAEAMPRTMNDAGPARREMDQPSRTEMDQRSRMEMDQPSRMEMDQRSRMEMDRRGPTPMAPAEFDSPTRQEFSSRGRTPMAPANFEQGGRGPQPQAGAPPLPPALQAALTSVFNGEQGGPAAAPPPPADPMSMPVLPSQVAPAAPGAPGGPAPASPGLAPPGLAPQMMLDASQGNPIAMMGLSPVQPVQNVQMSTPLIDSMANQQPFASQGLSPIPFAEMSGWGWGSPMSGGLFDGGFDTGGFSGLDMGGMGGGFTFSGG